ncbi:MAG: hypothetical protein U1D30_00250 [Planctomycetota bacterium]
MATPEFRAHRMLRQGLHLTTVLLQYGHRVMATDVNFAPSERTPPRGVGQLIGSPPDWTRDREAWEGIIDETDSSARWMSR